MSDWAEEKAREWLKQLLTDDSLNLNDHIDCIEEDKDHCELVASLAALLREVAEDKSFVGAWGYLDKHKYLDKAEVRRVVTEVCGRWEYALDAGDEILSLLEKL